MATGVSEASFSSINWVRSKANQQLVHQSKKKTLETIRRYAICGDGCCSSTVLHGHGLGQSFSLGYLSHSTLINYFANCCDFNIMSYIWWWPFFFLFINVVECSNWFDRTYMLFIISYYICQRRSWKLNMFYY